MGSVSVTVPRSQDDKAPRPVHHLNDSKTMFKNPWPSFRTPSIKNYLRAAVQFTRPSVPPNIRELIGSQHPNWGADSDPQKLKATWLGHACFLVELPSPIGAIRGPRILFDPAFSEKCSPDLIQCISPARFTEPPCTPSQLPEVDIVVYSHDHYDHMDKHTLLDIMTCSPLSSRIHIFAPLNNDQLFSSMSIPPSNFHCLDWWNNRDVTVLLPPIHAETPSGNQSHLVPSTFRLTCTPSQHFSGRGIFDRFTTLWSSWVIESSVSEVDGGAAQKIMSGDGSYEGVKLWFAGDTGYRTVHDGEDENKVPVCPVFREIGEKFGGFDLALIPIGAYLPRTTFSTVHCAPQDSVRIFSDVMARKAVGMHWGTWALSYEPVMAPAEQLAQECLKAGIPDGVFRVCELGETVIA